MNPLGWKLEHQIAGAIFCLIGAICGVFLAWMQSLDHYYATHQLSGAWSDYSTVFVAWIASGHYWPWPVFGAVIFGLAFYAIQLLRT